MITSSTIDHPISGSTPIITNGSDHLGSKTAIGYPVILSSVAGGLLGFCFIVCIVGLLIKVKLNRKRKSSSKFALSSINSLFYRYASSVCNIARYHKWQIFEEKTFIINLLGSLTCTM